MEQTLSLTEFKRKTQKYRIKCWAKADTELYLYTGLVSKIISFANAIGTLERPEDYDDMAGDILFMAVDFSSLRGMTVSELQPDARHVEMPGNRNPKALMIGALEKLSQYIHEDMIGCIHDDKMAAEQLRIIIACIIFICRTYEQSAEATLERLLMAELKRLMQRYPRGCFTLADHLRMNRGRTAV